jgi:hypothetical protein
MLESRLARAPVRFVNVSGIGRDQHMIALARQAGLAR